MPVFEKKRKTKKERMKKIKKLTSGLFHWLTDGTIPDR